MEWWGYLASGVSAIGDWVSDTFGGGSKSSKLSAQLSDSVEQQKALLASYEGTVAQLTSALNSKSKYLPWVLGGVGVLGAYLIFSKKRVF